MKEHFIKKIKLQGPITISDYMSDCLLAPNDGYYNNENVIGSKGDFITSPEISQMFGELVGLAFVDYWYQFNKPHTPLLVDIGGGNGTMMKDALRAIGQVDKVLSKVIQTFFIETSSVLSKKQKFNVPESKSFHDIRQSWAKSQTYKVIYCDAILQRCSIQIDRDSDLKYCCLLI